MAVKENKGENWNDSDYENIESHFKIILGEDVLKMNVVDVFKMIIRIIRR